MKPVFLDPGALKPEDPWAAHMRAVEERDKLKVRTLELALGFAAEDEAFRRKLAKGIRELAKEKRGADSRAALLRALKMQSDWELCKQHLANIGSRRSVFKEMIDRFYRDKSPESLEAEFRRYKRLIAKRLP
ncbi:hypothetical protein BURK2_02889 [Burkholderiales bacterium]|nr:MAG: hypothetical protein F9K47_13465 [Burkholderiales bacterium]CAG0999351.1 hypothetical protein BURK2_02889 [Burkholderiales bacterium]